MNIIISKNVSGGHIGKGVDKCADALLFGRPISPKQTLRCVNVRLVDGNVFAHEITERFDHLFRKGKKNFRRIFVFKSAHILKPKRIGKMMDREKRLDSLGDHIFDLFPVMRDRLITVLTFFRLNTAPFNAESINSESHLRHQINILTDTVIMTGGSDGVGTVLDLTLGGKARPVIIFVTTLDLRGGGGRT